jgi:hypothetical protein
MGRSRKNAKAPSRAKQLRNAVKETAAKQQYRAIHLDVRVHENAVRRELHSNPVVQHRENAARRVLHLDPVVQHRENAACRELRLDPVVQQRENAACRELHSDPVVQQRENAARRELHSDPVVQQRENAARQELHLDSVVQQRENADRRRRQEKENNEIGRGAITDINMSMEDLIYRIRNDKNGEFFSLADNFFNNALALFYANMGYHRF